MHLSSHSKKTGFLKATSQRALVLLLSAFFAPQLSLPSPAAGGAKKGSDAPWWNKSWANRIEVIVDTGKEGVEIREEIGAAPVLFRLVEGSFSFADAAEDGSDIRFVSEDGKEVYPGHIESFDPMYGEGFAWVTLPEIKPKAANRLWLYFGAADTSESPSPEASVRFDANTTLVYHFNDKSGSPVDSSGNNNNATGAPAPVAGALIGGGARFTGANPTTIPNSESLEWKEGQTFTFSGWVKPFNLAPNSIIFRRIEGDAGLVIGLDNGVPYAVLTRGGSTSKTPAGEPLAAAFWHHIGVAADGKSLVVFANGKEYARIDGALPASTAQIELGGSTAPGATGFSGEMDEVSFSNVARPAGWFQFIAASQGGSETANRLVRLGQTESAGGGASETLEHVMLFGDIAKNMMFDGWIAVGICVLMMIFGWSVAVKKTFYLGKIEKGNAAFLKEWQKVSSDLTVLDAGEDGGPPEVFKNLGSKTLALIKNSPIFHIYHVGSEEIRHRLGGDKNRGQGLSARSLQAIRAALDSSLVREQHRMSNGLVFLTISIAGGPYVGLLGTVVGVMITFALIAKTGDVEVNSIAPGIASALLATTVGLLVAIPALFIYSFLNSRIKQVTSNMQLFIDEFVAKVAEFYPPPGEVSGASLRRIDASLSGIVPDVTPLVHPDNGKKDPATPAPARSVPVETAPNPLHRKPVAPLDPVSNEPVSTRQTAVASPAPPAPPVPVAPDLPAPVRPTPPPVTQPLVETAGPKIETGAPLVSTTSPLLAAALAAVTKSGGSTSKTKDSILPSAGLTPGKPIGKLPPPRPPVEDEEDEQDFDDDEDFEDEEDSEENGSKKP